MVKTRDIETDLLKEAIEKSGLKVNFIVDKIGISKQAFYKKLQGKVSFRQSEIYVLCDLLNLNSEDSNKIFFPEKLG